MATKVSGWSVEDLKQRLVRYGDLRPCYNAFIDTRTPGSEAKENFTIIGPGVSENPDQYVHIKEQHGYNIGGARQPPGCVNSQHSHKTAEVFVVHKGEWRFDFGEDGNDAQVTLVEGDVVSIPTDIFRGFTNTGNDLGFLWAVLGENNPGRVTWAPNVFEMAKEYGLVLLKSGRLIDTKKGQSVPEGEPAMEPTSETEVEGMKKATQDEAESLVWRAGQSQASGRTPLIGRGAPFAWSHGFTMERLAFDNNKTTEPEEHSGSKVIFVQSGTAAFHWDQNTLDLEAGDTFSVPRELAHTVSTGPGAVVFMVREGDD